MPIRYSRELPLTEKEQWVGAMALSSTLRAMNCRDTALRTQSSSRCSKDKTSSFCLLLLPTPNGMGKRRILVALLSYKTLCYPELGYLTTFQRLNSASSSIRLRKEVQDLIFVKRTLKRQPSNFLHWKIKSVFTRL